MKLAALLPGLILIAGCTSLEVQIDKKAAEEPAPVVRIPPETDSSERPIDYLGLHRSLGLEREKHELGYAEKSFDTCSVGYGYSSTNNCQKAVFVSIHFQLLCRDSEGTVSTAIAREDMQPLSGRSLKWNLKVARGTMQLDSEGYGQIKTIVSRSQKGERLKFAVDNDFVYVRAGEVKRLVTPKNWCN
jgi:hypothetical protein